MVKTVFIKIRNIILLTIMFTNINGSSLPAKAEKQENNFAKDIIIELIGIDNTVIEFFEFILDNN